MDNRKDAAPGDKRGRDESISAIVDDALSGMKTKLSRKQAGVASGIGKRVTIDEDSNVEHVLPPVEEGPVQEGKLNDAYLQRQQKQAGHSKEVLEGFDAPEDEAEVLRDPLDIGGDFPLEAFNMRDEKEEGGYVDESGAFVRRVNVEEAELAKDAWLSNMEVVSEDVLNKIAEREQAEAQGLVPISDAEIARAKGELAAVMKPRESVMQALRRISAKPAGQQVKPRDRVGKRPLSEADREQKARIDSFLEAVTTVQASEADVYDQHKEELEHAVQVAVALAGGAAAGDDSDDIFGDDSGDEAPRASARAAAAQEAPPQAAAEASTSAQASASAAVDYSGWPVNELKRVLTEGGVDTAGCTEKGDLVAKMQALDAQRAAPAVPDGFVWDPTSGYYHNPQLDLYWDVTSKYYYKNGLWLTIDSTTGRMVKVPTE